jgi:hypothetical protein
LQVSGDLGTDPQSYIQLQNACAGFVFEYRDFNIRSVPLLLLNYQLQADPVHVTVAGRDCLELRVLRLVGEADTFVVDIDKQTGLVLASHHYGPNGTLLARVVFQTIEYDPDLSGVALSSPVDHELLDLAHAPETKLGFVPFQPKQIPPGFQFSRALALNESAEKKWACLEYVDGVECLFFLHGGAVKPIPGPSPAGTGTGTGQWATLVDSDSMLVYHLGPWTVAQGLWQGQRVIALGRLPQEPLLQMIESALP